MRTITTAERNLLHAAHFNLHARCLIQNADGVWVNLSDLGGVDWLLGASIRIGLSDPVEAGAVRLRASTNGQQLAPLIVQSGLNRNAANEYSPLLYPERRIRLDVAYTYPNQAPAPDAWRRLIEGGLDEVEHPPGTDTVVLHFRDRGRYLQDRAFIEEIREYGHPDGVPVEGEMQKILDDVLGVDAPTLHTPVSPLWQIRAFDQAQVSALEAVRNLALQIGWEVRYRWQPDHTTRLDFYEPPRGKVNPDTFFGPEEYLDVTALSVSSADVRNVVRVTYIDADSGERLPETRQRLDSIAQFGRRFMQIAEEAASNIDTAAEAGRLAEAAVHDLAEPEADQEIKTRLFWPAEIGDLYRFLANGVHYDEAHEFAVVEIRHELQAGHGETFLRTRGKPAGAYRRWLRMAGRPEALDPSPVPLPAVSLSVEAAGNYEAGSPFLKLDYLEPVHPRYSHMRFRVASRPRVPAGQPAAPWSPTAVLDAPARGPYRIEANWNTEYRVRPVTVSEHGVENIAADPLFILVPDSPAADAILGAPIAGSTNIQYPHEFDAQTAYIRIFNEEYVAAGGAPPSTPLLDDAALFKTVYRDEGSSGVTIPLAAPGNWHRTTRACYDHLNRPGLIRTDVVQGDVNAVAPPAPVSLVEVNTGAESTTLRVGMPADVSDVSALRVYRNGVQWGLDIPRTAAGGATQDITHSGLSPATTYQFKYRSVSPSGSVSDAFSPEISITTQLGTMPKPSVSLGMYDTMNQGLGVTITPGSGTPSGVTWHVEHSISGGSYVAVEIEGSTSIFHAHEQTDDVQTCTIQVRGTKSGWNASPYSDPETRSIPPLGMEQ